MKIRPIIDHKFTRRVFLRRTTLAAAGAWMGGRVFAAGQSPNEKLNIGVIGVANRAVGNIRGVQRENIVALCDVDGNYLAEAAQKFPRARKFSDFRKLLERDDIDAVLINTPDHTHALAAVLALKSGKHVYCEKPLTHSIYEARQVAKLAAEHPALATQMGIQIHAGNNYRRVVELIQSGAIGPVRECHVWAGRTRFGGDFAAAPAPVPRHLNWDLWLGPAPMRRYHADYHPKNWRGWWNFGTGTLGDLGCHFLDLVHWALKLRHPTAVEAEGPPVHPEISPTSMIVRYEYPAPGQLAPGGTVRVAWYDGQARPRLVTEGAVPDWKSGILFIGGKGMLLSDYNNHVLLPESKFAGFEPPAPSIPDSIGHHREWIEACKTGRPTTCNFDYGGALTEAVFLGNVAYRAGERIQWDGPALKIANSKKAMDYLHREYRKGWAGV